MDQDACMAGLSPLLAALHQAHHAGFSTYQDYPPEIIAEHDRAPAACVNDHVMHEARGRLEDMDGVNFIDVRGLRVLNYQDRFVLRVGKKLDAEGRHRNYPTQQQRDFDDQLPLTGLPEAAIRLTCGYEPDPSFTSLNRVIVARPMGRGIEWAAAVNMEDDVVVWEDITPIRRFEGMEPAREEDRARGRDGRR